MDVDTKNVRVIDVLSVNPQKFCIIQRGTEACPESKVSEFIQIENLFI